MKKILKKQKGFSLVEMIIYIAILGMIVVSFINFTVTISNAKVKVYVVQEVNANMRVVMNIISQKIREAENVIVPSSGNTSTSLDLNMSAPALDILFDLNGGILYLTESGETPVAITSSEVNVTNLEFTNNARSGERDSVKMIIGADYRDQGSREFMYSNSFETTVNTRK